MTRRHAETPDPALDLLARLTREGATPP
jgi:hypothetical protein